MDDREMLIKGIQECDLNGGLIGNCPYKGILALLKEQPEIVRCKYCKWFERKSKDSKYGYCHACKHGHYSEHWEIHINRVYHEEFFCANGERK